METMGLEALQEVPAAPQWAPRGRFVHSGTRGFPGDVGILLTERWLKPGEVEVARIGDVVSGVQTVLASEPLDQVLYLYLLAGEARVVLSDAGEQTVTPNTVLVVFPGRVVTVELTARSNRLMLLALRGSGAVRGSLRIGFWDLMRCLDQYDGDFMREIVERFRSASGRGRDSDMLGLCERLLETIYLRARNSSGCREIFDAVCALNRLPTRGLTTDSAAGALGISRTKLNSLFMSGLGMRPGEYISRIVLAQSLALLFWTRLSVAQVAARIGFSSASAFAAFLRRQIGKSPAEFRRTAFADR